MHSIAHVSTSPWYRWFWQFQSSITSVTAYVSPDLPLSSHAISVLLSPAISLSSNVLGCVNSGSNTRQRHRRTSDKSNSSLHHNLISLLQCVCVCLRLSVSMCNHEISRLVMAHTAACALCACFFLRINVLSYPAGEKISYCHHVREKDGEKRKQKGKDRWWEQWQIGSRYGSLTTGDAGEKRSIAARAVRTEEEEQHKKRKMQKLHQPQALESWLERKPKSRRSLEEVEERTKCTNRKV